MWSTTKNGKKQNGTNYVGKTEMKNGNKLSRTEGVHNRKITNFQNITLTMNILTLYIKKSENGT